MAEVAVFASGNGTNFQAIAEQLAAGPHRLTCLVCDTPHAGAVSRAEDLGIPAYVVPYAGQTREEAEQKILTIPDLADIDLIALAGFMRLLSRAFIDSFAKPILNVHPSLLPRYPGCAAIETSYHSRDNEMGITIHQVDYGLDSGPIILQKSFRRTGRESLDEIEQRVHELEHYWYPRVIRQFLDKV